MLQFIKKHSGKFAIASGAALVATGANAAIDYSTLVTAATAEINAAITAGLPVLAIILGVGAGLGMLRKFL